MLLPLRVAHLYQRAPVATCALLGANAAMFVLTLALGQRALDGLVLDSDAFQPLQLVTGPFLHVGFFHLAGNMLFLWVFGRYVEDRMGPWRYLAIYFACSVVADLFFLAFTGGRAVGASGAISGLMGFVLAGAPWAEIQVVFLWGIYAAYARRFEIAAFWMLGFWILVQLLSVGYGEGDHSGVAYTAHIGGFLAGAGIALVLRSPARKGSAWYLDPAPPGGGIASVRRLRRARGRPQGASPQVTLRSLAEAPSRVAAIRLLIRHVGLAPEAADQRLAQVEAGAPQTFDCADAAAAERFAAEARALGLGASVEGPSARAPTAAPPPAPDAAAGPLGVARPAAPRAAPEPAPSPAPGQDAGTSNRLASGLVIELEPEDDAQA